MDFEEKIKKIAYDLYEKNGRREGQDLYDWLAAEQIFRFEQMIFSETITARAGLLEYKPLSAAYDAQKPPVKRQNRFRSASGSRQRQNA